MLGPRNCHHQDNQTEISEMSNFKARLLKLEREQYVPNFMAALMRDVDLETRANVIDGSSAHALALASPTLLERLWVIHPDEPVPTIPIMAGKDEVATFYGVFDAGTPEHAAAEADPNRKGIMIVIHTVGPNGKFLDENGRGEDLNA
eukprot:gene12168-12256_t